MKYLGAPLAFLLLQACDYQGDYTFKVTNETSKGIELIFKVDSINNYRDEENKDTVYISGGEEMVVRIICAPLNSPAHNCLKDHGLEYFKGLPFDTYVDSVKIEKELFQKTNAHIQWFM